MNNARALGDEVTYKRGGIIQTRAQEVLRDALTLLETVRERGMFEVLADGVFADVKRPMDAGKGADGVFVRSGDYFNPVEEALRRRLDLS